MYQVIEVKRNNERNVLHTCESYKVARHTQAVEMIFGNLRGSKIIVKKV